MKFSSILLSIIFHAGIFFSLTIFLNSELRQRTNIEYDLVSFQIIENDFSEEQSKIISNKQFKKYKTKKDESKKNLIKKNQNTDTVIPKARAVKNKNFESKKNVKVINGYVPRKSKKINKKKLFIKENNVYEKSYMTSMPNIENYKISNLNKKFYGCFTSQRPSLDNNNKINRDVNKNITISALLGNNFYYNPNSINISNLLKNQKILNQKEVTITELLNRKEEFFTNCN